MDKADIDNDKLPKGLQMFNNNWGMGPFYSYNKNFENLKDIYDESNARDRNFEEWIEIKNRIAEEDDKYESLVKDTL